MIGDPTNSTAADAAPVSCKDLYLISRKYKKPKEERNLTVGKLISYPRFGILLQFLDC